jgi:hypothetical protein
MHLNLSIKQAVLALLVLAGFAFAVPAGAHHGGAVFDRSVQKQLMGTVKTFEYTNPHCWIWLDVANDKGGVDTWGFEGTSPNSLSRQGWSRTTLKPGDKITVFFYPLKDGSHGGSYIKAVRDNGEAVAGEADH